MGVYKRGKFYHYDFWYKGQRIKKSTKHTNKRAALDAQAAKRTELANDEVGIQPSKPSTPTLATFARTSFLPHCRATIKKPKTLEYYENGAKNLLKFQPLAAKKLEEITDEHIGQYVESRLSRGLTISTANSELQVLRRMFSLAQSWKKTREPLAKIRLVPGANQRDRVVSPDEETEYLLAAPSLLRDVATIILDCGLRPEECFRLRWANVEPDAIRITFGKTKAARRRIPATDRVKAVFDRRHGESPSAWVFPAKTQSGHIEPSSVKKQQARTFKRTGIDRFVLYSLRHTCLTRWAPHMDPYTLAYLAGHSDMNTTKRYIHPADETVRAAFDRAQSIRTPTKIHTT